MVKNGSYICGEDNITYREVESLYRTPETNVMLCVNYPQKVKRKGIFLNPLNLEPSMVLCSYPVLLLCK